MTSRSLVLARRNLAVHAGGTLQLLVRVGQGLRWGWLALITAVLAGLMLLPGPAAAHEMSMAEMAVREVARGDFVWQWTARDDRTSRASNNELAPQWPAHCRAEGQLLRCGDAGLQGSLTIDGVGDRYSAAMVKVTWLDGQTRVYTLTGGQPKVQLFGAADDTRGWGEIARAYVALGVEHILSGIDHLAFVLGLLFLVGFRRQLLWTITAFTVAHSLTLGASALGWLMLRSPPVEATIALSIVLVASEALNKRPTLSRRWPALVAFLFGLVHGLGFAGALQDIGLPQQHLLVALLSFNVGAEAGQLGVVLLAWGLHRLLAGQALAQKLRVPALYVIGSVAAWWTLARVAAIIA